jgi:hypothetical protein
MSKIRKSLKTRSMSRKEYKEKAILSKTLEIETFFNTVYEQGSDEEYAQFCFKWCSDMIDKQESITLYSKYHRIRGFCMRFKIKCGKDKFYDACIVIYTKYKPQFIKHLVITNIKKNGETTSNGLVE